MTISNNRAVRVWLHAFIIALLMQSSGCAINQRKVLSADRSNFISGRQSTPTSFQEYVCQETAIKFDSIDFQQGRSINCSIDALNQLFPPIVPVVDYNELSKFSLNCDLSIDATVGMINKVNCKTDFPYVPAGRSRVTLDGEDVKLPSRYALQVKLVLVISPKPDNLSSAHFAFSYRVIRYIDHGDYPDNAEIDTYPYRWQEAVGWEGNTIHKPGLMQGTRPYISSQWRSVDSEEFTINHASFSSKSWLANPDVEIIDPMVPNTHCVLLNTLVFPNTEKSPSCSLGMQW